MRNAQRLSPSEALPWNVPISTAAVPGTTVVTSDFRRPHQCQENYGGTLGGIAVPIPYMTADPSGVTVSGQAAWASGDVGSGIDTNFSATGPRTYYVALGFESEALAQIGTTDGTLQPTGRLMEFGWDARSTWFSFTMTQQTALQKITINVPSFAALQPPACVGVTTFRITVWVGTVNPANAVDRLGAAMSYVGEGTSTGAFSVVMGYSKADLGLRQYFPANLRNAVASRAVAAFGKRLVFMGNSIGIQSRDFRTDNCSSVNDTLPRIATGAANNLLVLRRDLDAAAKPYDPRVMVITNIVRNSGVLCTVTVANYQYLANGDTVFIDDVVTDITGINATSHVVSNITTNTFQITGVYGAGTYTSGGEAALLVFTIPDWWIGLFIAISGTVGNYQIIRSYTEGGTVTGIEVYPALPAAITAGAANAKWSIVGKQTVRFGQSDPRFLLMCPSGEDVEVGGRLRGDITGGIASPDGNGFYVYSRVGGLYITNIAREVPITGLAGSTPQTQPRLDDTPLAYGCAGPNALWIGPNGTIIGWSPFMGFWIQEGSSQRLLDAQQLMAGEYTGMQTTATTAGVEDITPRIQICYSQNDNLARAILPKQDQWFRYDFRTSTLAIDNAIGQKLQACTTTQQYAPLAYDITTASYLPDDSGNVGDCSMFAVQEGDISEWNDQFFVDLARYYDVDSATGSPYQGTVSAVAADTITTTGSVYSEQLANEVAMITDTAIENDQSYGTITGITLSGAGRYATVDISAARNVTIGSLIVIRGVVGITGINSAALPATPTYWSVSAVPSSTQFTLDSGAAATFAGTWTSGGRATFLSFAQRLGSYRELSNNGNSAGGTLDFTGENPWTAGAPLIGDIVTVQPLLARYESTDVRVGTYGQLDQVDRFAMDDESSTGYAVALRVVPSGLGFTPSESDAITTAYSSMQTSIGKTYNLYSTNGGESVRVRVTWPQPVDGATRLNSFILVGHGMDGQFKKQIGVYPDSGTRANRQYVARPDLNVVRDADAKALSVRGGSRVLSVFYQSRPYVDGGSGGAAATNLLDNVVLVLRVGGQPFIAVSTFSARYAAEGFENGTVKMQPVLTLGTIRPGVPDATY